MRFCTVLAILVGASSGYALGATEDASDTSRLRTRRLPTGCIGDTLEANDVLALNQQICTTVSGEEVSYGVYAYPASAPGYTTYKVEMKSSLNTYNRSFQSIYTQGDAPTLKLQGDGNLVFGYKYSWWGCVAVPDTQGGKLTISEKGDNVLLQITDSNEDVLWKFGRPGCYPDVEASCVSVLEKDGRLSWNEYICTFDSEGNIDYKFGLSKDGLFGLWRGSFLIWRPGGEGHLRGEYLDIQGGFLVLYNYDPHINQHIWRPGCYDLPSSKVVLTSEGDVQELNDAGAITWNLLGSQSYKGQDPRDSVPELCRPAYD
jgi:hypothetical protein